MLVAVLSPSNQALQQVARPSVIPAVSWRLHGRWSLSNFQVLKSPLLDLTLPEAEFDSGKINVSKVLPSLPGPCPHTPDSVSYEKVLPILPTPSPAHISGPAPSGHGGVNR